MSRRKPLEVGDVIHGFAQGGFGRDHYDCVKIEAAGPDWIVARAEDGGVSFATGESSLKHLAMVRDTDRDQCKVQLCPLEESDGPLTIPGGY